VKNDEGKVYIPKDPNLPNPPAEIDEIGFLEPGHGYFLGFKSDIYPPNAGMTGFDWNDYPGWPIDNIPSIPSKGEQASTISSAPHFQYKAFTHFFYPIFIDTVISESITPEFGDEIGVFDGGLCVGAAAYADSFPVRINAWEDDVATPDSLDGYICDNPMTFIWYDASTNQEIVFVPPATINAVEVDNPIAPTHSGFGAGLYAVRSLSGGDQSVVQLPQTFKLLQNYPNPFNSETVIPLELPQRSQVKIELFNVCGQSLGVVYQGIQEAGWQKIPYNASALASGLYFCRVTAQGLERNGSFTDINKLLLLK